MKNFIQRLAEKRTFPFDKKKDDDNKKKPQDAKSDNDEEEKDDDSASDDKENDKLSDDDNAKKDDDGEDETESDDDDDDDKNDDGDEKSDDKDFGIDKDGDDDEEKEDGEDKDDGEPLPPNPSSKTLLNNPKDQIKNESIVFTFARMNPPNRGHEHLVNKIKTIAEAKHSDAKVFLSHSHDPRKNPLPYEEKMIYARKAFGDIVAETTHTDLSSLLEELHTQYKSVTLVVGEDQEIKMLSLIKRFPHTKIVINERLSGVSSTNARTACLLEDFNTFSAFVPSTLREDSKELYNSIRANMNKRKE